MPQGTVPTGGAGALIASFVPLILLVVVFYFFLIRPQQKRDKETRQMLEALKVGDNITTIGGIYGKIVSIKDEVLTIETGSDKTKLVIARWAVKEVENPETAD
ncbi:preprotein translocase subunit YajC [Mahella australiensis]|uniref:Protein translocase subunit yajC n=1 Tax=Mahella australiensis (strain DSM 15567 / CIP 107919 / 50-1 BON) TaxID=697281 RepID=F4A273_MAHA5|nr:preprotein translocase subunit YajC [Mahella australiensis]AEE96120.1 protein translocase subunit yajC [Mahella australiensis 50-1 BON]